jgi:hypothetical protein
VWSFDADALRAEAYMQHRGKNDELRFSTVDLSGRLRVVNSEALGSALRDGIGHGKAFGCGLMMLRAGRVSSIRRAPGAITMHTLTTEDLALRPQRLLDDAARGETSARDPGRRAGAAGRAAWALAPTRARCGWTLPARLYDSEQISLGVAARIAGLSYSEMIDALGARGIATIRLEPGELQRELAAFGP